MSHKSKTVAEQVDYTPTVGTDPGDLDDALDDLRARMVVEEAEGGGDVAAAEYTYGILAADQTTGIGVGDPLKIATWSGTLTTDGGTYRGSLEAGKAYRLSLTTGAAFSGSTGYVDLRFYDVTNAGYVGQTAEVKPPSSASDRGAVETAWTTTLGL